jgi:hypothetical protein
VPRRQILGQTGVAETEVRAAASGLKVDFHE